MGIVPWVSIAGSSKDERRNRAQCRPPTCSTRRALPLSGAGIWLANATRKPTPGAWSAQFRHDALFAVLHDGTPLKNGTPFAA